MLASIVNHTQKAVIKFASERFLKPPRIFSILTSTQNKLFVLSQNNAFGRFRFGLYEA